jgi:hypothetical protein
VLYDFFTRRNVQPDFSQRCWRLYTLGGDTFPGNAFLAGTEDYGDVYVGRAVLRKDLLPGKIIPRLDAAYFAHDGREIKVKNENVEWLIGDDYYWENTNGSEDIPSNAVVGGRTSGDETLYIGRVLVRGNRDHAIGKVKSHRKAVIQVEYFIYQIID